MTEKLNRCYFQSANSGDTDPHEYASAESGFMSPTDAGAVDGGQYAYIAENGSPPTQWEIGIGTYTASSGQLSRTTIVDSSNAGAAVNFSAAPKVRIGVPLATDFPVETIARADFGATPAASMSFDLDVTQYAAVRVIVDGLRLDTSGFSNGDYADGLYFTAFDPSDNELTQAKITGGFLSEKADLGDGYVVHELVPVQNEYMLLASPHGVNLFCSMATKDEYIDGVFGQQANDAGVGNNGTYSPAEPDITVEIKTLLNESDPINFVAGTITVMGTRK